MKTEKITPGPWAVSPYMNITSRNGTIAKTEQMPGNDDSEREANAHLIAAAPDLLSAVKELLPMWESGIEEPWINRARAAIAKAEGVSRPA